MERVSLLILLAENASIVIIRFDKITILHSRVENNVQYQIKNNIFVKSEKNIIGIKVIHVVWNCECRIWLESNRYLNMHFIANK